MRNVTGEPAPPGEDSALGALRELIASHGGQITFERFMREVLYHPQHGYYTRRVRTVGRAGDFSTSATLHGALGRAVAAWAKDRRVLLGASARWHLIELGGGGGQLADETLRSLGWWARRGVCYHMVERSQTLRQEQRERLAPWPAVHWHEDIETALRAAAGHALIFSNEFVDAFPCVRLEWDAAAGDWREVSVGWRDDTQTLVERLTPWQRENGDGPLGSAVLAPDYTATLANGQRVEWHWDYLRWLQAWNPLWSRGAMLTIDYGDELPALYHRWPGGTLRAYYQHVRRVGHEVYAQPGRQDLTADVNFTDLLQWGAVLGLSNVGLSTQADFFRRWLPAAYTRRHRRDRALSFVLDEAGAGGAFKVLEQRPDLNRAQKAP